jgi:hypothetical protein
MYLQDHLLQLTHVLILIGAEDMRLLQVEKIVMNILMLQHFKEEELISIKVVLV